MSDYTRVNWQNGSEGGTPINADNLNIMDNGISAVDGKINNLSANVPFKFGIDADGNYGYYKDGADTVTPFKSGGGAGGITLKGVEEILEYNMPGKNSSSSGYTSIGSIVNYLGELQTFRAIINTAYEGNCIKLYNNQITAKKKGRYLYATYYNAGGTNMTVDSGYIDAEIGDVIVTGSSLGQTGTGILCAYLADDEPIMDVLCDNAHISDTTKYLVPVTLTHSIYDYRFLLFELKYNNVIYSSCSVPMASINIASESPTITLTFNNNELSTVRYGGSYKDYYLTIKGIK